MYYITDENRDPYWNLAAEEYLLKNFSQPVFRLWRNSGSIIIGQYQNAVAEIDLDYVEANGIKVVRRLTGGGAVFHDLGNLNFTFIEPFEHKEDCNSMFRRFTAPILEAINSLGVKAYIEGRNDLLIDGCKFSGNAMCIYKNRVLQHGTLLFSASINNLGAALKSRPEKFIGKAVKSTVSRVTNISDHLGSPMTIDEFQRYLGDYICNKYNGQGEIPSNEYAGNKEVSYSITRYKYTESDLQEIERLRNTKYSQKSWNFGKSPVYSINNVKKFKGGLVEASFTVKSGLIESLEIFGDYFFTSPTEEFIMELTGTEYTKEAILENLERLDTEKYFSGISCEELLQLFI